MQNIGAPVVNPDAKNLTARRKRCKWLLLAVAVISIVFITIITVIAFGFSSYVEQPSDSSQPGEGGPTKNETAPPTPLPPTAPPIPTSNPSSSPSPSYAATHEPTMLLSPQPTTPLFFRFPTTEPSMGPSVTPSVSSSVSPTASLSEEPSVSPSVSPQHSAAPSWQTSHPTQDKNTQGVFYAIADVPYNPREAKAMREEIMTLPSDGEFLVHLGDIKEKYKPCTVESFKEVRDTLLLSPVPVFMVVGDNEYNDCSDPISAMANWKGVFNEFDKKWSHQLEVTRPSKYPENFSFVYRRTLYIGLNIVGGRVHDQKEWDERLSDNAIWTMDLFKKHTDGDAPEANGVVIFGHANPHKKMHKKFFSPVQQYIQDVMINRIPVLYMGGDVHKWLYEPNFYDQSNFLRIRLSGGTKDQALKMFVDPSTFSSASDAFKFEREWDIVPRRRALSCGVGKCNVKDN